eukprot:scpid53294/ scgid13549/ 
MLKHEAVVSTDRVLSCESVTSDSCELQAGAAQPTPVIPGHRPVQRKHHRHQAAKVGSGWSGPGRLPFYLVPTPAILGLASSIPASFRPLRSCHGIMIPAGMGHGRGSHYCLVLALAQSQSTLDSTVQKSIAAAAVCFLRSGTGTWWKWTKITRVELRVIEQVES